MAQPVAEKTMPQDHAARRAPFRVIYSNDCTNICTGEVLTTKMIEASVDETVEAGVEVHMLQPGGTYVPFWQSKIYPPGEQVEWYRRTFGGPISGFMTYLAGGRDIVGDFVRHCRRRGIVPFVSVRLNDYHGMELVEAAAGTPLPIWGSHLVDRFRREHPEHWICPAAKRTRIPAAAQQSKRYESAIRHAGLANRLRFEHVMNWAEPAVRERMLGFIREICEGYDVEGLELDFMRCGRFFRVHETSSSERVRIMTEFVRRVRALLGSRWLCVRVPAFLAAHDERGIDLREMVAVGVDMINLSHSYYTVQHSDLARVCRMFPDTAVYYEMHYVTQVGAKAKRHTTPEQYFTTAYQAYRQGAQGVSLFNFQYYRAYVPCEPPFEVLRPLRDVDALAAKPQHYFLQSGWASYLKRDRGYPGFLGRIITSVLRPGQTREWTLYLVAPADGWRGTGRLRLQSREPFDDRVVAVRLNGTALSRSADVAEPYPNPYPHLLGSPETLRSWSVPRDILREGHNVLSVTLTKGAACNVVFLDLAL